MKKILFPLVLMMVVGSVSAADKLDSVQVSVSDSIQANDTIPDDSIDYARYLQEIRVYGVTGKKKTNEALFDKEKFKSDAQMQKLEQDMPEGVDLLGIPRYLKRVLGIKSKEEQHKEDVKKIIENY